MSKEEALEAKKRGNKFFAEKDWEKAASEFSKAIENDPSGHVYFSNRSACHAELGDFQKALEDAQQCVKLNPTWAKGYSRCGQAYFRLNKLEEAKKAYKKGLEIDEHNANLKEGLSIVEQKISSQDSNSLFLNLMERMANDPNTAKYFSDPQFKEKLSLLKSDPQKYLPMYVQDPQMKAAMEVLFKGMMAPGSNDQSAPEAEKTAEQSGKAAESSTGKENEENGAERNPKMSENDLKSEEKRKLGNEAYKRKSFDEAISLYTEAFALSPKNVVLLTNRATAKMQKKDFAGALKDCEEAIETGRKNAASFRQIAKAFERCGDIAKRQDKQEEAVEYYKKSLLEMKDFKVTKKLDELEEAMEEKKKTDYFDKEIALKHKEIGNKRFKESKWKEAADEYTESIRRNPNDAKVYSNRAAVYSKLMAWDYALKDCHKSIEIDPSFSKAYLRKGKIQHLLKDYVKAVRTFQKGLEVEPDSTQLKNAKQETMKEVIELSRSGKFGKEQQEKAMRDPEIQKLVNDPKIRHVLEEMKTKSAFGNSAFNDPSIMSKLEILMAAGIVQFG